ncbi:MAG: tetratricopeptide repeat protein [Campylobacterota bacterium]|nr:tetratricopeptide repeat protein [Campylobacterota bacterium]
MTKEYKNALKEYDLKNYEKAYTLFEKSAKSGEVDAQVTLVSMLYEGNKIRQDISKACFWYEEAAKQDDLEALHFCAVYFMDEGDIDKGKIFLNKAIEYDYPPAINTLGTIYDYGDFKYESNKEKALELYKKACLLQERSACLNLYKLCKKVKKIYEFKNFLNHEIGYIKYFKIIMSIGK